MIQRLFEAILAPVFRLAAELMRNIVRALLGQSNEAEEESNEPEQLEGPAEEE